MQRLRIISRIPHPPPSEAPICSGMIAPGNHVIEKSAALCNTPGGGNVVRCKIKQLDKQEFEPGMAAKNSV